MCGFGLAQIRKITDQFERDDGSDTSSRATESADRRYRLTVVKVGGQHIGNGAEGCETEDRERK